MVRSVSALGFLLLWVAPSTAAADPEYVAFVPNGAAFNCATCHNNPCGDGCGATTCAGTSYPDSVFGSCLNPFGHDYRRDFGAHVGYAFDSALRDHDSDGDGRTNGQELVYFGDVFPGETVGFGSDATNPGDATSIHTDECRLQANAEFGFPFHPLNYTNCDVSVGTICTNTDADIATPAGSRYFGFDCTCEEGFAGNGRLDVPGDGVSDPEASGCVEIDECDDGTTCTGPFEECQNLEGSFECLCVTGYERSADGAPCTSICGDGMIVAGEECDDGFLNSDFQRNACRSNCMAPYCGDGVVDASETCDPGGGSPLAAADCACPVTDAGRPGRDAGGPPPPPADAGGGDAGAGPPADPGGCGCRTTTGTSDGAAALLLVALLFARRRR